MEKQEAVDKFNRGEITINELAKYAEVSRTVVYKRINRGMSAEDVIKPFRPGGKVWMRGNGYLVTYVNKEEIQVHTLIAETALGKKLPKGAAVHHVNEVKTDNKNRNLVICQDASYHRLLHLRQRALNECGNVNYSRCQFCNEWDDPKNMYIKPGEYEAFHRSCRNKRLNELKRKRKNKQSNQEAV